MPRRPECDDGQTIPMSLGGGILFSRDTPHISEDFFRNYIDFLHETVTDEKSAIIIVGGGILARMRQADAAKFGVTDQKDLDILGISVTRQNAFFVQDILENNQFYVQEYTFESKIEPGWVYIRGGTEPGHTTDYVAVQAAIATGSCVVYNIGREAGLHPFTEDGFDPSRVIDEISFDELIPHLPNHSAGLNVPFDKPAALLARENGISVILVGSDVSNLQACIRGEDFVGTIIHP